MIPHRSPRADATHQTHPDAPAVLFGVPQMTMPIPPQSGPRRGNIVATSILSSVSTASRKPPDLQALDPGEPINAE
jgi:hypothetical protein